MSASYEPRWECTDCGGLVLDMAAHERFHAILNSHALVLALLQTSHTVEHVHNRYDIAERIDARRKPADTRPSSPQGMSKMYKDAGS